MKKLLLFSMLSFYVLMKTANCYENSIHTRPMHESQSALLSHFGSLLGSGRSLSFPFAPGLILSVINENIWNVSTNGFEHIFKVRASSMGNAYKDILNTLKKDSKSTLHNFVYQNNNSIDIMQLESLKERLSQFSAEYNEMSWDSSLYWEELDDTVSNLTNGKLKEELFPKAFGRIFDDHTEAAILSTFHYKNNWKYDWKPAVNSSFGDIDEIGSFLETDGEFLVSEEDEYTAVAVPLMDEKKSVVFVLPTYNLTKHFRGYDEDEVPLPHNWVKRNWKIKIPEVNFAKLDQYGKELQQLGINETFCTTIHDQIGKFPFYLRPVVQANYVNLNSEFLEIASATGTAVQEFALGADINGNGHPLEKKEKYPTNNTVMKTTLKMLKKIKKDIPDIESVSSENHTFSSVATKEISFNRPFLWYINDNEVGPIFFGFVNSIAESNSIKMENSTDIWKKEISMVYLWSCKSFAKTTNKPSTES